MRTMLGLLLAVTLMLAGCGSDDSVEGAEDPASPTTSPTTSASEPADVEPSTLALVSEPAVGGEVDPIAVALDAPGLAEFGTRFEDERMLAAVEEALARADVPEGQVAAGAVVAIGCDPPQEVDIEVTDAGVEVTAPPVKSPTECFAPITTVAVVAVDPGDL